MVQLVLEEHLLEGVMRAHLELLEQARPVA